MAKKIVIIGGVAGGATAAARLRRLSEEDEIIIFEKDEYISFANCGLPYYIGDVITDREKLIVQSVEGMSKRFHLDIRNFSEVMEINPSTKVVKVRNHKTNELYEESFDALILSPGAKPIVPPFTGLDSAKDVFTLRNIPDTDAIYDFIVQKAPKHAVVIGGGFIGVEMAENLVERGMEVTLIEKMPQVLAPLDFEMAQTVHQTLSQHGVDLLLNDGVEAFENEGKELVLTSGKRVTTDMVIMAIGVAPTSDLAKNANFQTGPRGHIIVNERMQMFNHDGSVASDCYAIGDAIEVVDYISQAKTAIPLAWPANRQGRLVADIINGRDVKYNGSLGSSVLKVFDLTVATTGNNERTLKMRNIPYMAIHAHRGNHASYYPQSKNIALKLLFDPATGKILGAQGVGGDGTEKRIDVLATAIKMGGTVLALSDLELCYAPPFSSAKDPVNVLGYIAENLMEHSYKMYYVEEIKALQEQNAFFLDVRTPLEFGVGHIPGAHNMEVDELRNRIADIPVSKDTPIYVNCQVGFRAYLAIQILKANGFTNLYNLSGGYNTYKAYTYKPGSNSKPGKGPKESTMTLSDEQTFLTKAHKSIDVVGLQCPGPLLATYQAVQKMAPGDILEVVATDSGFTTDAQKWCETNGHRLLDIQKKDGKFYVTLEKGEPQSACLSAVGGNANENATIVLFSGELDKALAAMVIAQGAAAQGKKVTVFFTFWGLNALRKKDHGPVQKNFIEKMFGIMMPKGAKKLHLSKMDMMGAGRAMIKGVMRSKNIDQLEVMMQNAQDLGVNFMACTMSMDMMGIKEEELMDGISYGGVAAYIGENEKAGTTLFI
ncbi:MAG: CoA-disulfide reductase [Erysipelotrichaceae bacterium]